MLALGAVRFAGRFFFGLANELIPQSPKDHFKGNRLHFEVFHIRGHLHYLAAD